MPRTRSLALLLPLAVAGGLLAAPPSAAAPRPMSYALPALATFPEGITTTRGTFYVTSTTNGTVVRGNVRTGETEVFLAPESDGRTTAVGLEVTRSGDRLVIAGGDTGKVFVYDARSGELVASYDNDEETTFLNDVTFDKQGNAYITDSQNPVLYRLSAAQVASGGGELEEFADFEGTALDYETGFNANGLAVTPNGRYLLVVQSNTGELFRVDLRTRAVREVDLGGAEVEAGDGIELRGNTLYVVRNRFGIITEVKLSRNAARGRVVSETTDNSLAFPTTAALAVRPSLIVNSQFDQRGPDGDPTTPFTVTSLRRP